MIRFHRLLLPLLLVVGVAWAAPDDVDDRIALKGVVNGHPVKLIVDTGAGADILLWQTATASLGLSITPPPADLKLPPGQIPLGRSNATTVEVFGRTFPDVQISVVALPSFVPADSHGMIGWTAISQARQAFYVAERRFTTVAELPSEKDGWVRLALLKESKVLELVIGPAQYREHVLVDTGSSDGIKLSAEKWRAWRAAHPRQPVTRMAYFNPLHGVVVGEESWDDDFVLEGLHFRGVAVASSAAVDVNYEGTPFSAIIGLRALERIDLVTDGAAGIALARSRSGPPAPYQHNRLGAVFTPRDASSDDLVAEVAEGTPAARAGIRQGDVLLAIDRLDVTPWRTQPGILPLSRFWSQPPGTKLVLRVRRDNRSFEIPVTLVNILGPNPSGR
jgi:hypothetical protein